MADKTIICKDCGAEFIFSNSEQAFYREKGFNNEPTRCPKCRGARKQQTRAGNRGDREMFPAICASCGKETMVPFKPRGDKPVYCKDCFKPRNSHK